MEIPLFPLPVIWFAEKPDSAPSVSDETPLAAIPKELWSVISLLKSWYVFGKTKKVNYRSFAHISRN
jgi:hypothetical protein